MKLTTALKIPKKATKVPAILSKSKMLKRPAACKRKYLAPVTAKAKPKASTVPSKGTMLKRPAVCAREDIVLVTTKAKLKVMRKPSRQDNMGSVHAMAMVRSAEAQPQMAVRKRPASVGRTTPYRESLAATTHESSTSTKSLPAETLTARSPGFSQGHSDALRSFLLSAKCLTDEPAAFQLRCKQPGTDGKLAKVVIVVGGKCRLFKLNQ